MEIEYRKDRCDSKTLFIGNFLNGFGVPDFEKPTVLAYPIHIRTIQFTCEFEKGSLGSKGEQSTAKCRERSWKLGPENRPQIASSVHSWPSYIMLYQISVKHHWRSVRCRLLWQIGIASYLDSAATLSPEPSLWHQQDTASRPAESWHHQRHSVRFGATPGSRCHLAKRNGLPAKQINDETIRKLQKQNLM